MNSIFMHWLVIIIGTLILSISISNPFYKLIIGKKIQFRSIVNNFKDNFIFNWIGTCFYRIIFGEYLTQYLLMFLSINAAHASIPPRTLTQFIYPFDFNHLHTVDFLFLYDTLRIYFYLHLTLNIG